MTDLVERLRAQVISRATSGNVEVAAIAEIERNRAAIAELVELLESYIEPLCGCVICEDSRAAITKHTTTTKEGN